MFDGDNCWGYGFYEPTCMLGQCTYDVTILKAGHAKKTDGIFMVRLVIKGIKDNDTYMSAYVQYWIPDKHDVGMCTFVRREKFVDPLQNVTIYSPDEDIRKLANAICVEKYTDYYSQGRLFRYKAEEKARELEEEMLELAQDLRTEKGNVVDAASEVTVLGMFSQEEIANQIPIDLKKYFNDYVDNVIKRRGH